MSAGFTLVEVLVAMTIMAIIAMMCWQGVDGIVRARNVSQHRLEQVLRLNTVIAQWEQDLANLQESPAVPGFAFDGGTVRMTRRADKGLQVVTWSLMPTPEGAAGGGVWLRWAGPVVATGSELQENWMRTYQFQGNEAGQLQTLKGLVQWQVYCIYQQTGAGIANCQSSGNTQQQQQQPPPSAAPPGQPPSAPQPPQPMQPVRQALPDGVRLVLEFSGELNGTLTKDVALGP